MKTNKKNGRKATSVRVPSWDPAVLNSDLLRGVADDPMIQGVNGWAYGEIREFINKSFPVGHNPLETLRRVLPQWVWSISDVSEMAAEVSPWEGEIGHPAYCAYCAYCGNGKGGGYGEEQILCQWTYSTGNQVFWIQASRPVKGLAFVAKTSSGRFHFVEYRTEVHVSKGNMNWQEYPAGSRWAKDLAGKETRFVSFDGLIPEGTKPIPVEPVGPPRDWEEGEGDPGTPGSWGKSGVETDYRLPDGTVQTKRVCTGEWP